MLRPIDLDAAFHTDAVRGRYPQQLHSGVGWWVGSCLVLTRRATGVVVVTDDHEVSRRFAQRFAHGAINCHHYAATVTELGAGDVDLLHYGIRTLLVPGALITTTADLDGQGEVVTLRLFGEDQAPIVRSTGLDRIRRLIADDRVPLPVNSACKGRIVARPDLAAHYAAAEG